MRPTWLMPTKDQWRKWSLPSKLTAVGAYIGVIGFILFLVDFIPAHFTNRASTSSPSLPVDSGLRPKGLTPQAFYLHHQLFPVRGFPFDLYLGLELQDFKIRYGSLVTEELCPFNRLKLYRLKPGQIEYDRRSGWINESATAFLFDSDELVVVTLSIVVPPEKEPELLGELDQAHPIGFGTRYDQDSHYIWLSEKGHALELLSLFHGLSSGVNDFTLMRTDYPLNDLLSRLTINVPRLPTALDAFRGILAELRRILSSDTYATQVYPQFGFADVNRQASLRLLDQALGD